MWRHFREGRCRVPPAPFRDAGVTVVNFHVAGTTLIVDFSDGVVDFVGDAPDWLIVLSGSGEHDAISFDIGSSSMTLEFEVALLLPLSWSCTSPGNMLFTSGGDWVEPFGGTF